MTTVFIDTNIFVYHITGNHPDYSPRCTRFLQAIEDGNLQATTSVTAIDETFRVLTKAFGHSLEATAEIISVIVSQSEIAIDHREAVLQSIKFWTEQSPLSFVDCYHLALTQTLGINRIATFDKKMDRYPGVERIEPE